VVAAAIVAQPAGTVATTEATAAEHRYHWNCSDGTGKPCHMPSDAFRDVPAMGSPSMKPSTRLIGAWFVVLAAADHVVTVAIEFVLVTAPET